MVLIDNLLGNYRFLKGIAPYSSGVVSKSGFEIVHARLSQPIPLPFAFQRISQHLVREGRPIQALCGMELRISAPLSFTGFNHFNQEYQARLKELGLLLGDVNPVARTNIAVAQAADKEPIVHAYSYTVPTSDGSASPTFIVAGAGDLRDQTDLTPSAIIRPDETSEDALREKASCVMQVMQERLSGLQASWSDVSCIDVYTIHPVHPYLVDTILEPTGRAAQQGINWYFGQPPIEGLAFEMDLRGVRQERWIRT